MKASVIDGMTIRLAASGPQIQIRLPPEESKIQLKLAQIQRAAAQEENKDRP
jgi:hypothetical protein